MFRTLWSSLGVRMRSRRRTALERRLKAALTAEDYARVRRIAVAGLKRSWSAEPCAFHYARSLRNAGEPAVALAVVDEASIPRKSNAGRLLFEAARAAFEAGDLIRARSLGQLALEQAPKPDRLRFVHMCAVKTLPLPTLEAEVADWLERGGDFARAAAPTAMQLAFYQRDDWQGAAALARAHAQPTLFWATHAALALVHTQRPQEAKRALDALRRAHPDNDEADMVTAKVAQALGDTATRDSAIADVFARHDLATVQGVSGEAGLGLRLADLTCDAPPASVSGPRVSMLMTVYRRTELLDVAVASVLRQTYGDLELLIVDDCSPDDTLAHLYCLAEQDSRIRVLEMPDNRGTYAAKNWGLTKATGEYISFMDADDWTHPQRIERQVSVLRARRDAMAVLNSYLRVDAEGHIDLRNTVLRLGLITLLMRREVLERLGYFDPARLGSDSEYYSRLRSAFGDDAVVHDPAPTLFALKSAGTLTGGGEDRLDWRGARGPWLKHRLAYQTWHRRMRAQGALPYLPHPLEERPYPAPASWCD